MHLLMSGPLDHYLDMEDTRKHQRAPMIREAQSAPLKGIWQYACASICKPLQRCLSKWIQPSLGEDPGRIYCLRSIG
jgi:hypothetical protein